MADLDTLPVGAGLGDGEQAVHFSDASSSESEGSGDESGSGSDAGSADSPKLGRKRNKKKPMRKPRKAAAAPKPKAKKGKDRYVDKAAAESDGEGGDRDEEDDEEEDGDDDSEEEKRVRKGFIVDSDEEDSGASESDSASDSDSDDGSGSDAPRPKKLRRVADREKRQVDDDDLALVREAAEEGIVRVDEKMRKKLEKKLGGKTGGSAAPGGLSVEDARAMGLSEATIASIAGYLRAAGATGVGKGGLPPPPGATTGTGAEGEELAQAATGSDSPAKAAAGAGDTMFEQGYDSEGMDDFIEDDLGGGQGGAGRGVAPGARGAGRQKRYRDDVRGVTSKQLDDFQGAFGTAAGTLLFGGQRAGAGAFDLNSLFQEIDGDLQEGGGVSGARGARAGQGEEEEEEEEEEEDEEFLPPEEKAAKAAAKAKAKAAKAAAALRRVGGKAQPVLRVESMPTEEQMGPLARKRRELQATVEPGMLEQYYVSDSDVTVRARDEPERLQLCLRARRVRAATVAAAVDACSPGSLVDALAQAGAVSREGEVEWMVGKLCQEAEAAFSDPYSDITPSTALLPAPARADPGTPYALRSILAGVKDEGLEVPFLWQYRRDELAVCPGMSLAVMWSVLDLDDVWGQVTAKRVALAQAADKALAAGVLDAEAHDRVRAELLAPSAASLRGVADVQSYLQLALAAGEAVLGAAKKLSGSYELSEAGIEGEGAAGSGKSAAEAVSGGAQVDLYRLAHASDMRALLPKVFLPAHELAANVRTERIVYGAQALGGAAGDVPDTAEGLRSLAFDVLDEHFTDEAAVLAAASHVASTDLARHAYLRRRLRETFFRRATVRTEPTARGKVELDPSHPYFGLHCLRDKQLSDFATTRALHLSGQGQGYGYGGSSSSTAEGQLTEAWGSLVDDEQPGVGWEVGHKLPTSGPAGIVAGPSTDPMTGALLPSPAPRYPGPDSLGMADGYGASLAAGRVEVLKTNPNLGPRPKRDEPTYGDAYARAMRHEARVGGPTQWLLLARAQAEGYITVHVEAPAKWAADSIRRLSIFSMSPLGVIEVGDVGDPTASHLSSEADRLRRGAVQAAVQRILLPEFIAEAQAHLTRLAHEAVAAEFACSLRRHVLQAPPAVPPQPLRKRKAGKGEGEGGQAADDPMDAAEQPSAEPPLHPWVRARYRTLVIAVSKAGDARVAGDMAVMLDPRGDLIDSLPLPSEREARKVALSEFMFAYAPDMVVLNTSAGVQRSRDMRRAVLESALIYEDLALKARRYYKKRRDLKRLHGDSVAHSSDARVRAEWAATFQSPHLEASAEAWSTGRWKFLRPRAPASRSEMDPRTGEKRVVPDETRPSSLPVLWTQDDVARAFVSSPRARAQGLSEQPPAVRYAVSLGRYAQDPLAEVAYMWAHIGDATAPGVQMAREAGVASISTEVLSARLHALQDAVPAHLLCAAAERVMVEAVNGTGLDVNGVSRREHLSSQLQFVAGMGPRKAAAFLDAVASRVEGGVLLSRAQVAQEALLGPTVYRNAIAFLRVNPPWALTGPRWRGTGQKEGELGSAGSNEYNVGKRGRGRGGRGGGGGEEGEVGQDAAAFDPLDSTRVHPEHKDLAAQFLAEVPKEIAALTPAQLESLDAFGQGWEEAGQYSMWGMRPEGGEYKAGARLVLDKLQQRLTSYLTNYGVDFSQWRLRPVVMALAAPPAEEGEGAAPAAAAGPLRPQPQPQAVPDDLSTAEREPSDFLEYLDLDAFHGMLVSQGKGSLRHVLELIKAELRAPFRDTRRPTPQPTPAALFRALSGETSVSLRKGALLTGRVDKVMDDKGRVQLVLENGLRATVSARGCDLPLGPDGEPQGPMSSLFKQDAPVTIRVTRIGREGFYIDGEAKRERTRLCGFPVLDAACDVEAALRICEEQLAAIAKAAKQAAFEVGASAELMGGGALDGKDAGGARLRAISHPFFRNATHKDAADWLAQQPLYSVVFRPSSRGYGQIVLMWKLGEPALIACLDVAEGEKDAGEPASLGRTLTVGGGHTYGDLDELVARYVQPCSEQHRAVRASRVFKDESTQGVEDYLAAEFHSNPHKAPYCISPVAAKPGYYQLSYMWKGAKVRHEPVKVTPGGLLWRDKVSPSWRHLIDDFKQRARLPYNPNKAREAEMEVAAAKAVAVAQQHQAQGGYHSQQQQQQVQQAYAHVYGGAVATQAYGAASMPPAAAAAAQGWDAVKAETLQPRATRWASQAQQAPPPPPSQQQQQQQQYPAPYQQQAYIQTQPYGLGMDTQAAYGSYGRVYSSQGGSMGGSQGGGYPQQGPGQPLLGGASQQQAGQFSYQDPRQQGAFDFRR